MFPDNIATLLIGLLFFVPGFIVIQTKRRLVPLDEQSSFEEAMTALAVSTVIVVLGELLWRTIVEEPFLIAAQLDSSLLKTTDFWSRYSSLLAMAMFLGMGWAWVLRIDIPHKVLKAFGFTVNTTPSPWDWLFRSDNDWLRVHLIDGRFVQGEKEYASAYPHGHQLLLKRASLFERDSTVISKDTRFLVSGEQIAYVVEMPGVTE